MALACFLLPLELKHCRTQRAARSAARNTILELMGNVLDLGNYPLLPLVGSHQGKSNKKANNKQNVLKLDLILSPVKKIKTQVSFYINFFVLFYLVRDNYLA